MEDPEGAKHLPTLDYVEHHSGAILPLPVRESEMEERQDKVAKKKAKEDKETEDKQWELIAEDVAAKAFDPNADPYKGIKWRNGK